MNMSTVRLRSSLTVLASTLVLGACSADNASVTSPDAGLQFSNTGTEPASVRLVKRGPAGSTATFSISATGGTLPLGSSVTLDACPPTETTCFSVEVWFPTGPGIENVTITETSSTGNAVFSFIGVTSHLDGAIVVEAPAEPTITVRADNTGTVLVRFKNDEGPAEPALRVVKTAGSPTVSVGSPMSFSMTVYSDGPATATNVTLSDPLPGGAGIVWQTGTAGCSISGSAPAQTLSCAFGDLAAGLERSVTVTGGTSATLSECRVYSNTVTVSADNHADVEDSAEITLTDCVPLEFAGCTPGFWKQQQHYQFWSAPYAPSTAFGSVFTNAFPGMTLLQVVGQGGGGINALGRHAVAALLNSASPDVEYGMTPAAVISAFNAAVASGDYETQKNIFEAFNERGCTAKD